MGLTVRETEILELLKKEPLISQVELADRLGITRSSVAVHISNLMKKGVILGKGYVFNQEASIVVFGESTMRIDISEQPENRIDMHLGGFAFEAARAFSELSVQSKVVTVVGKDRLGEYIIDKMQESKTDVSNVFRNHPLLFLLSSSFLYCSASFIAEGGSFCVFLTIPFVKIIVSPTLKKYKILTMFPDSIIRSS